MKNSNHRDSFILVAPKRTQDGIDRGVIRVRPRTYDLISELSKDTGMSICRIVEQCVMFALERLEDEGDAE